MDLGIVGRTTTDVDRRRLRFVRSAPSGINGADLTGTQLGAVRELLLHYVETCPEELTAQYRHSVPAEHPSALHFAWRAVSTHDSNLNLSST
ncbi:hypothetical protein ACEZCY_00845 [Streptacidiphilus sp. N1-12]|uniref:Uncharacterized protein n=2 Tax=Streptacidiphilus alkalitolerans TaxID=3342712 RepID=A0ABV6V277_9ACTN